jgi:RNA polymerase sigma-70 factor, ECF subfamily
VGDAFHDGLVALLPGLRRQAWRLTRNRAAAEDLVQDTVVAALAARDGFLPGSSLGAWTRRILRNRFLTLLRRRRRRDTVCIDDLPVAAAALVAEEPAADGRLALEELRRALGRLPAEQREALVLVALEGRSYGAAAAATGVAVGTVKSTIFRARQRLRTWLLGEEERRPARPDPTRPGPRGSAERVPDRDPPADLPCPAAPAGADGAEAVAGSGKRAAPTA